MSKLALCVICKGDEVDQLKRLLDSVGKHVDGIFITTTQLKNEPITYFDKKIEYSHFPWVNDFSKARNFNFQQAKDYDYILWLDSDDVLIGGENLKDVVAQMEKQKLDAVFVDYNYEIDPETKEVVIVHPRERIVKNGIYEWKGALHETLIPKIQTRTSYIKDFKVNHFPTEENKKEGLQRNFKILAARYNEEVKQKNEGKIKEIDPRTEYYLGRILYDMHTNESLNRASQLFQDYLEHSGWDEERAQAWNYLGNIFYLQGNYNDSVNCYHSAIKERPEFPTWYIMLSRAYIAKQDFDKAEFFVKQGLSLPQPKTAIITTPRDDKMNALFSLFVIYFQKRDMKKALKFAEQMYAVKPDKETKDRIKSVKQLIKMGDWLKVITAMAESLDKSGRKDKVAQLLDSLPDEIGNTIYTSQLRSAYIKPKIWPNKSIVWYAASDFEPWSPKSLKTGIGGSEEAIIYLSKEMAKLGYSVTVYANVGKDEGTYDGVEYLNFQRFNHRDKFDILIGWRNPQLFRHNIFDARLILLDLHDVPVPEEFTENVLNQVDYIMVKSKYHRSLLPKVPDSKFIIIPNGIDSDQLSKVKGKHKRYKVFYGSSYDRGLHGLLKIWPEVKKAEPLAELHICYGWNLYDKLYSHVPSMMAWKKEMETMMSYPGVIHHGRVGKEELYQIASDCGIWAYPTTFEEIHCITGAYCQALGTVPCVYNYAALDETVQRGIRLAVDPFSGDSIEVYKKELINLIKNPQDGKEMRDWALNNLGWDKVAKKWDQIEKLTSDIKVSVITPTIRNGWWNLMAENLSKQTYKNIEWIIVDDHKEDRSHIAKKYAQKYGLDIKYTRGERAVVRKYGLSSANNVGWQKSSGELLVWLQDFVIIPPDSIERLVNVHTKHPNALIAPVDEYRKMSVKPNMDNREDWFDGKTDVSGEFIRQNIRIGLEELRYSDNPYDFEMNIGAIPKKIVDRLNGWWEFFDDALGYDNTEIAMRAMELGYELIVDERLRVICLDLWEHIRGTEENGKDREYNLNDPRYIFLEDLMKQGLSPVRNEELDRKLLLEYDIPKTTSQEGAVKWMEEHLDELVKGWKEKYEGAYSRVV